MPTPEEQAIVLSENSCAYTGPSFSLRNRLARTVWSVACTLFFRPTPASLHAWRAMVLRLFGATLGARCHIYPKAIIWAPWNLTCGDETGVANGAILYNQARITLGTRSVISQGSHLCTGTHDYRSPDFRLFAKPIAVGDHAWVAAECFIHPGVSIGEGTVIGARSVVTQDMPAWTVCAGNPCKPLKPREMKLPK
jgi:putative colanic acid biosynthesis acetyltransferase WcaF